MTTTLVRQHHRRKPEKAPDPFADDIARRLASKRLRSNTSEPPRTEPMGNVEAGNSAYAGVWKSLARAIGLEGRP
jgi:hypothetical protein